MNELIELLYGERGILYRIESGREDMVVSAEKEIFLDLARKTNLKYHEGTLTNEELFVYIDVMDVLSSFQHVDWIRELKVMHRAKEATLLRAAMMQTVSSIRKAQETKKTSIQKKH